MTQIIAPIGYARTGKDEFAKVLVEEYGFKRFAFADKLRECLYALNPIINPIPEKYFTGNKEPRRLQSVIGEYGWDNYKDSFYGTEIRELLQRFGTDVGRDLLADDIWLRELDKHEGKIVVTDTRFPNELDKILEKGGTLIHVTRPGYGPINKHISETAHLEYLSKCAHGVVNDGTLSEYRDKIYRIINALGVL